jgi:large subunit ribosomal protein L4
VFDTTGKAAGTTTLPKEIFGQKPDKSLLSQALHIYFTNSSTHFAHTKTRAEVRGGGKKPWRQKGTGRARAGSSRSPLWVGGGKTFGPRARDVKLTLPAKMKKRALYSALSQKVLNGDIKVISSLEKIQPKTKIMANLLANIEVKSPVLLVTTADNKNIKLASKNIQKTSIGTPNNLNAYQILRNRDILISSSALEKFI